jgi:hypothetical protein
MKIAIKQCQMVVISYFWMAVLVQAACGGTLSDFKKDVSKSGKNTTKSSDSSSSSHNNEGYIYGGRYWDHYHDHYFNGFEDIFYYGMAYGGISSWERVNRASLNNDLSEMYMREAGEVLIPFLRIDASYQKVKSDVDALNYSVDGGYGPIGIRFAGAHFKEQNPDDTMDITQIYGLYRMSYGGMVEIDIGVGSFSICGEHEVRFSFTIPVLVHPSKYLGFEFRPVWAENISEYDVGVFSGVRYVSFKTGYRWLSGPAMTLDGPYAGLTVHF